MLLLVVSLLALVIGPVLYRLADAARPTIAALDGLVMVTVGGLVLVHIIPHAVATAGWVAIALAFVGFLGPGLIERSLHRAARRTHTITLVLALSGLVVHAFLDGVALGAPGPGEHGHHDSTLALAVVLHRLPVAITVWWLLRPSAGRNTAIGTLLAIGLATLAGYTTAESAGFLLEAGWLALLQSLIGGSLLHVIVHRPTPISAPGDQRFWAGAGALVGLAMVAGLADAHLPLQAAPESLAVGDAFVTLALATAPALLVAFALAGMVQVFLPRAPLRWMRTGHSGSEALRGVAFGLPLPICSCGVIPLYQSLTTQAVPATAAMAFLVATPELGLDAILISLPLLGAELTLARVACALLVALSVGWLVGRWADARRGAAGEVPDPPAVIRGNLLARVRAGLRFGFGEIVDHVGPWLVVGLAVASVAEPLLRGEWLAQLPWGADVFLFAVLGIPVYVCASGATPLAAVLIHKGVSPGAALAFLLAGPATNITTFGILARLHGRRIALAFGGVIAGLAIGLGLLVNLALPDLKGISLHEISQQEPSVVAIACLAVLCVVFALSIIRQGPRGFLGQIVSPYEDDDDHCHDDHCHDHHGHDH